MSPAATALTGSGSGSPASAARIAALSVRSHGRSRSGAAEVPVRGGLAVDRPAQVQRGDDRGRAQVEVALDERLDLVVGDPAGPEGVDAEADRMGDADAVGHLDLEAVGEPGRHHVLGDPARGVGRGPVDLRRILAARTRRRRGAPSRRSCRR